MTIDPDVTAQNCADATPNPTGNVASRPHGRLKRKRIIDAAAAILMESGYDGLVMREVAARAQTRLGNVHYYFPTKQALLLAIFDHESNAYTQTLRDAVLAAKTRKKKIVAIVDASLSELAKPQQKLWRILVAIAQHDPDALQILRRENELFHMAVAAELRKIEPHLTAQNAKRIARIIWAMLDGFAIQLTHALNTTKELNTLKKEARAALIAILNGF